MSTENTNSLDNIVLLTHHSTFKDTYQHWGSYSVLGLKGRWALSPCNWDYILPARYLR